MKETKQIYNIKPNTIDNQVSKELQDIREIINDMISLNPEQKKQVLGVIEDQKTLPAD